MNIYKISYKNLFLAVFVGLNQLSYAGTLSRLTAQAKKLGTEVAANKKALATAGLAWGGFTGVYYAGTKKMGDFNPEVASSYTVPDSVIGQSGLDKNRFVYIDPTVLNAANDPSKRWLTNGKGFWGNLVSLGSPSDTYIGTDGKVRVPVATAQQLSQGEGIKEFLDKVKDQEYRYNSAFDYKTYAECAVNTALWTPVFMLSPVSNALKSAKVLAELGWTSGLNRIIRAVRDHKGHTIVAELSK